MQKPMTVRLQRITIGLQQIGVSDEFMVSRAFFDLVFAGQPLGSFHVDIKQAVGSNFEDYLIEVGPPRGYAGPFNHSAFREAVERYYRGMIGPQGRMIHISGPVRHLSIVNSTFEMPQETTFPVEV
jgi:hypothetical protein